MTDAGKRLIAAAEDAKAEFEREGGKSLAQVKAETMTDAPQEASRSNLAQRLIAALGQCDRVLVERKNAVGEYDVEIFQADSARAAADLVPDWSSDMDAAPKDKDILVWYDHDADPYHDPEDSTRLTDYAAWTEAGDFLDGSGLAIARWQPAFWEAVDEYGSGYWLPAAWFAREDDDYIRACNPTHWMPLPAPPKGRG